MILIFAKTVFTPDKIVMIDFANVLKSYLHAESKIIINRMYSAVYMYIAVTKLTII